MTSKRPSAPSLPLAQTRAPSDERPETQRTTSKPEPPTESPDEQMPRAVASTASGAIPATICSSSVAPAASGAIPATICSSSDAPNDDSFAPTIAPDDDSFAPTIAPDDDSFAPTIAPDDDSFAPTIAPDDDSFTPTIAPISSGEHHAAPTDAMGLSNPERYELREELGRGGMGRIILADDQRLQRSVAIKECLDQASPKNRQRFEREALISAQLQHPGIVNVHDAGHWPSGELFYTMARVEGQTLADVIDDLHDLDARTKQLPIILDIAEAMAYAHSQGVIHRDLKPENVLIGAFGETVVIDWGLAKRLGDSLDKATSILTPSSTQNPLQTMAGSIMGTLAYMAPEQAAGDPVDTRADVFAIGAIMYHLLCGQTPFEGQIFYHPIQRAEAIPNPLREIVPDIPPTLLSIVERAMEIDLQRRYLDAAALADDLRRFTTGQLVRAHQYNARALIRRWIAQHRTAVLSGSIAALIIAIAVSISVIKVGSANRSLDKKNQQLTSTNDALNETQSEVEQSNKNLTLALNSSLHENGKAWLERAQSHLEQDRHFSALLMLSKALGLDQDKLRLKQASVERRRALELLKYLPGPRLLWQNNIFNQHINPITQIATTSNGDTLISADTGGNILLWNISSGALLKRLDIPSTGVNAILISPDDQWLVAAAVDRRVHVWSLVDFKKQRTPQNHRHEVSSLTFTPDGSRLLSADLRGEVITWSHPNYEMLSRHQLPESPIYKMLFSPDGKQLITGSHDGYVRFWDAETLSPLHEFHANPVNAPPQKPDDHSSKDPIKTLVYLREIQPTEGVKALAVSPNEALLAFNGADDEVVLWDLKKNNVREVLRGHSTRVLSLVFSDDGSQFVSSAQNGVVKVWDIKTGQAIKTLDGGNQSITKLALSSKTGHLFSAGFDRIIRSWSYPDYEPIYPQAWRGSSPAQVRFAPLGEWFAVLSAQGRLFIRSTKNQETLAIIQPPQAITGFAISPDGRYIATLQERGSKVLLWDAQTGELLREFIAEDTIDLAFHPDNQALLTITPKEALIWNHHSGELLHRSAQNFSEQGKIAFNATGQFVGACQRSEALFWRYDSTKGLSPAHPTSSPVACNVLLGVADSPAFIIYDGFQFFYFFNPKTNKALSEVQLPKNELQKISNIANRTFATISNKTSIKLWSRDGQLHRPLSRLKAHPHPPDDITLSPDGSLFLSLDKIAGLRLWSTHPANKISTLKINKSMTLKSIAFDPHGRWIASYIQGVSLDNPPMPVTALLIWDQQTWTIRSKFLLGNQSVFGSIVVSPNGEWIAVTQRERISVINSLTGQALHEIPISTPKLRSPKIAIDPKNRWLFAEGADRVLNLWSTKTWRVEHALPLLSPYASAIAASPDGRWLAITDARSRISVWDLSTLQKAFVLQAPLRDLDKGGHLRAKISHLTFSYDSLLLASANSNESVSLWDIHSRNEIKNVLLPAREDVVDLDFSDDATQLLIVDQASNLLQVNIAQDAPPQSFKLPFKTLALFAFSPDKKRFAAISGNDPDNSDPSIHVFDNTISPSYKRLFELVTLPGRHFFWRQETPHLTQSFEVDLQPEAPHTLLGILQDPTTSEEEKWIKKIWLFYRAESFFTATRALDEALTKFPLKFAPSFAASDLFRRACIISHYQRSKNKKLFCEEFLERHRDDASKLNQVAWFIADEPTLHDPALDVALKMSARSNALTDHKHTPYLDTLARLYFEKGALEDALMWQRRAVSAIPAGKEEAFQDIFQALERYERAAEQPTPP